MFNSMKNFVKAVPAEYVEKTSKFTSRVLDSVQQSLDSTSHSLTSRNMCNKCNSPITVLSLRVFQSSRCCLCGCTFCGNCLQKAQAEVPEELLHDDFLPKGKSAEAIASSKQKVLLICIGECSILYKASQVEKFRKDIDEKFGVLLAEFLNNPYEQKLFFPRPDPSQDSTFRRALRFAVIAEVAADFAGYSMIFQAVKYTFYSSELVRHLIGVDIMPLLNPLLNSLKEYNITGPTALLSLYYLSCQHTLEFKMKTLPTVLPKEDTSGAVKGLLTASCPDSVLHYLRRFVAPAQWLYISLLPSPHHTVDWSSWYMSHIIKRQGWTVVMAINEATQLPNGFKCPAFALVTRCRRAGRQYGKKDSSIVPVQLKEAMLIIRGTKTTMDWTINLDDSSINFSYYSFNQSNEASGGYTVVDGHVHKGMYEAAIGILQSYNLRRYILQLCNDNYDVKIVGHSLGAGVAALIAAEMRNSLFFISSSSLKSHTEGSQIADDMAIAGTSNITPSSVRRMAAICFSSPSCVSENLAERWLNDELLLNVVYGNDLVPRLNRQNCARLAEELKKFAPTANEWLKKDKKAFYNYVSTLGKASDMAELVESPVQASKAMVAEKDNPEQSSESEALSLVDPELPMVAEQPQLSTVDLGEVSENLEDLQSFQANPDLDSNKLQEDAAGGGIILVTPSPIVHIRQNFDGSCEASLLTHKHEIFQRMVLLLDHALQEHSMMTYREGLHRCLHWSAIKQSTENYNSDLQEDLSCVSKLLDELEYQYVDVAGDKEEKKLLYAGLHALECKEKQSISYSSPPNEMDKDANAKENYGEEKRVWQLCSVCDLDCNWPYIFKSDAMRSKAMHNCSACGKIVCTVCSPSADKIHGDDLKSTYQLADYRIPLPKVGIHYPQRVCLPCYFDSN